MNLGYHSTDSDMTEEEYSYYMEENMKSIKLMKQELQKGKKIYYTSWW